MSLGVKLFLLAIIMRFTRVFMQNDFSYKLDFDYGFGRRELDILTVLWVATLILSLVAMAFGL
jgi:hypothetical protein